MSDMIYSSPPSYKAHPTIGHSLYLARFQMHSPHQATSLSRPYLRCTDLVKFY